MQFVIVLFAFVGCAFGQFNKPFGLPTRQQVFRQPTQFQVQPQYNTQYRSSEYNARIRQQQQDIAPDGSYSYSYDTDNGISVAENGSPKAVPEGQAEVVQGQFSYTAPDGTPISVRYFADENGFRAEGAHLPTPPPIPEAIQRSIIFNQQHPEPAQPTYQQQPAYQQPQYKPQTYNTFGTRRF